jgi:RNA polymerase sigma-70 factor (ECF subfamily)
MTDTGEFVRLADPFRRELLVHCYRMLGSADEAEDLVQETYLRAWRSYAGFEGRSSLRSWLYRIATNACLTALDGRGRRALPAGLGGPGDDPNVPMGPARQEVTWLRPLPDAPDPAAIVASRGSVRLAMIAALQLLPPRQRAVLILRDVLAWQATEVADLLGTSTVAVKSSLQRARAQLHRVAPAEEQLSEPAEPELRVLLDRYMSAFEKADVEALLGLLRADAELEMPPFARWFRGRDTVAGFFAAHVLGSAGTLRLVRVAANGQPAVAAYQRDGDGCHRAHAIQVLTVVGGEVARIVAFLDPGLFRRFGLVEVLPVDLGTT